MKNYDGSLDVDIAAVVGNYDTLQRLTERFDIPYHCVSHEGLSREAHEQALLDVIDQYQPDYLVSRQIYACADTCVCGAFSP